MIYPPISDLVKKTGTRYSLAILTARRARQLGADSSGEFAGRFDEAILEAIDEINAGKVTARPKNHFFDYINTQQPADGAQTPAEDTAGSAEE